MTRVFDELHVVSDLHIGGESEFQIFNQGARLAAFVDGLTASSKNSVGLILGGDIVDFLAEPDASYFDALGAIAKLEAMFERKEFACIMPALRAFAHTPGRSLILVLGNHDVELALPPVRAWLFEQMCGDDEEARARVDFAMDGTGYLCKVADKTVLCVHGNEVDSWNAVDYACIDEQAAALASGEELPPWDANAGTRMVIDVINEVKRKFPVADLLKPEFGAAAPVVVSLEPSSLSSIGKILRIVSQIPAYTMRLNPGLLSASKNLPDDAASEHHTILSFAEEHLNHEEVKEKAEGFFKRAYHVLNSPVPDPLKKVYHLVSGIEAWFDPSRRPTQLRKHLKKTLVEDRSFDLEDRDEQFELLDKVVPDSVHFLIAGHTHLERSIARSHPGTYYFNSGTWTRLIQLTHEILDNDGEFEAVYDSFLSGDIRTLDAVRGLGSEDMSLVLIRPSVVSIVEEGGEVYGELRRARADGSLEAVAGSRRS